MAKGIRLISSFLAVLMGASIGGASLFAQEHPISPENPPFPIQVEVSTAQNLNFGAFVVESGAATYSIDWEGRDDPNGVIPLNFGAPRTPGLFDVIANPGTIITINTLPNIKLVGSQGGVIHLDINSFSTGQTFITHDRLTEVFVGGILRIDNKDAAPAGKYSGQFTLIFNYQ